ncbi:RNA polymerase sigma factor for flagellar operon FliA [Novosphingobium sp. PhB165]|uniref:sigma-70 family RNA polymerase sigma factor n=1 Tax=Novosphingobium sp. PhB165 TaxID=2485105 RepID=UPI001050702F|nr:sigma-70 family RNA polymerase sigma factor [Novosphingobium sp. PhB165]TCM18889.1 RNA polymerase sigma factor for flagellar operon FliA [Novosphingobium sp. PhB165]
MKQDQRAFGSGTVHAAYGQNAAGGRIAGAYQGDVADRVRRFLPMVRRLAWHVHGSGRPGIEVEDLIQSGLVALTECAQKHQGPTEDGFAAYAKMRVRGAMVDLIRRTVPMSRGASERRRLLAEKERDLRGTLGREPHGHELAEAMGMDEAELAALRDSSQPLRFDSIEEAYSDRDMAFADERPDSLTLLADEELRGAVVEAIAELPERLRLVVQLYFVEELNLAEIAQVLQVSIPRVHQLKAQALGKLRESLEGVADIL